MTRLEANRVPPFARDLLPAAERWGIGDDYDRERAVEQATDAEVADLVRLFDDPRDEFWEWLAGPASFDAAPSTEYVALTCLTMAFESAKVRLARRARP